MIGTIFDGSYQIKEKIGSGGMADVYKAWDIKKEIFVALKILKSEYTENAEFIRRFKREATSMYNISHKNIVRVYEMGIYEGMYYIAMEYIEGITLKNIIRKHGALPVDVCVYVTEQICDALYYAHNLGIVHRDIKPQNIIVIEDWTIKIVDFGIARDVSASTMTFMGPNVLGSVHYISPEQAKGEVVDHKSDIYSLGIVLYEMLTGVLPFEGDTSVTVALKHINEEVRQPSDVDPMLPESLSKIVMKAVQKDPAYRYETALMMRKDLERALDEPDGEYIKIAEIVEDYYEDDEEVERYIPSHKARKNKPIEKEIEADADIFDENKTPITPAIKVMIIIISTLTLSAVVLAGLLIYFSVF